MTSASMVPHRGKEEEEEELEEEDKRPLTIKPAVDKGQLSRHLQVDNVGHSLRLTLLKQAPDTRTTISQIVT